MLIEENKALSKLTSLGIGGTIDFLITLESSEDLQKAFEFINEKKLIIN